MPPAPVPWWAIPASRLLSAVQPWPSWSSPELIGPRVRGPPGEGRFDALLGAGRRIGDAGVDRRQVLAGQSQVAATRIDEPLAPGVRHFRLQLSLRRIAKNDLVIGQVVAYPGPGRREADAD